VSDKKSFGLKTTLKKRIDLSL